VHEGASRAGAAGGAAVEATYQTRSAAMSKTDIQLKQDIEAELRWAPKVNAAQTAVSVDKGAVSLRGVVDAYAEKWAAENATNAAWATPGVTEVVDRVTKSMTF
jgi:osmotically-inducible protein OsmY